MPDRLIFLTGAASRSKDGTRLLGGLLRYLETHADLVDAIEGSYRAHSDGAQLPYDREDTSQSLASTVHIVAANLGWHRRAVAPFGKLHLVGWSLGGAVLFEAAAQLVGSDPSWRGAFGAIVTFSSPLNGCDLDGYEELGAIAAGEAGRELCRRAADPAFRDHVQSSAALLRNSGVRLVTLGSSDDVIVTAADSIVAPIGESPERYTLRPRPRLGADVAERTFGHGAILDDPIAWRMALAAVRGTAE